MCYYRDESRILGLLRELRHHAPARAAEISDRCDGRVPESQKDRRSLIQELEAACLEEADSLMRKDLAAIGTPWGSWA